MSRVELDTVTVGSHHMSKIFRSRQKIEQRKRERRKRERREDDEPNKQKMGLSRRKGRLSYHLI